MKQAIKQFLKPDWRKIILFGIFMFIEVTGYIQSWAFAGKKFGTPRPPFYDIISLYPFWLIWATLLLPLIILSIPFRGVGTHLYFALFPISIVYFYLLSCLIVSIYDRIKDRKKKV